MFLHLDYFLLIYVIDRDGIVVYNYTKIREWDKNTTGMYFYLNLSEEFYYG